MMKRLRQSRLKASFLGTGLLFVLACDRSPVAPAERSSATPVALPMPASRSAETSALPVAPAKDVEMERALDDRYGVNAVEKEASRETMSRLDAKWSAEDKLAEVRRRTMVTPAPAGFRPEEAARKVRLRLILERNKIRVGEKVRFRLEMTNVGREPIDYRELGASIFVEGGGLLDSPTMKFHLTDSDGIRKVLSPPSVPPPGRSAKKRNASPEGLTERQTEDWVIETNAMGQARSTFRIKLLPGETLTSVGDVSPADNFKTLYSDDDFDKTGRYRLRVDLDDRPAPLDKDYIEFALSFSSLEEIRKTHDRRMKDALGPLSSNEATLEVVR